MKEKFRIRFCSDLDYEEMVADVCYEDHLIATISQDKGEDKMEVEIFPSPDGIVSWKFSLDDLIEVLNDAKKSLIDFKKLPE